MKNNPSKIVLAVGFVLALVFAFSCTSNLEMPPPPDEQGNLSSGVEQEYGSSSSLGGDGGNSASTGGTSSGGSSASTGGTSSAASGGGSSGIDGNSSSSVRQEYSSSTTSSTTPSSSSIASVGTTYYCDFGLRETCPSCANGVGGGCFEMESQYGECDLKYAKITTSCSTGLVCDWGIRHKASSLSECGKDYCGGCYVIGSGSGITPASCETDNGTVRSSCPESSLVSSSSVVKSSSSSITPSSSSIAQSSSSAIPICGVEQFCSGAELLWNQTTIQGAINTANKCYFTKQITASNGNSGIGILINGKEINGTNCPDGNLLPDCPLLNSKVDGGYYIKLSKVGGYADITMTADKPPCSGSPSSSSQSYEDIYCSGATTIRPSTPSTIDARTTGAVCFKITGSIIGWSGANAYGRICKANNGSVVVESSGMIPNQIGANAIGGYVYINCSAGSDGTFTISAW